MHAAKALGRIQDGRAVPALMPLLHDKVKAVRAEAATALAAIGPAAVPALVEALKHEEWLVRLHAVEALGKVKAPAAVPPLLFVLFNDRDSAVREDSVRALGEIGSPETVEFLVTVLKDPTLRPLAVEALGRIGDHRAVPVLIDIVTGANRLSDSRVIAGCSDKWDEEMVTRGHAVRALGAIGDPAAIPALVAALQETVTRAEAAGALAKFGAAVIPVLLPLLAKEQDENIRYYLKETLTQVGWRPNRI
jgi:HEAT repeat protein